MDLQAPQERGPIQDGLSDGGMLDRLQNHEVKHTWVQVGVTCGIVSALLLS